MKGEMPMDLEMLFSASNSSFYSYSVDSATYSPSTYDRSLSFPKRCEPRPLTEYRGFFHKIPEQIVFEKKGSYASKHDEEFYGVRKKKVSFADDKGLNLVEVCEIPGAPKWADNVITLLIGSTKCSVVKEKKWKVAFQHPPWPDEKLMNAIEENNVALEHISVQDADPDCLSGTVKVKNLAFEKRVFFRVTFDRWMSYMDVPCTYRKPKDVTSKLNKFDTFSFSSNISPVASRYEVVEFCICFQCGGKEYWDNNKGINYRLVAEYSKSI